jgi:redox-sensitive bicupin YhaK (pirin superfamily)
VINIRKSEERGHADYGWLNTYHTFSFNTYNDERYMGFRSLRVINEDRVKPGRGFGTHPHQNMEIISYVLEGELEHKDSTGTGSVIRPGDVQYMSAGRGILHSEFNPSNEHEVHFLQIWIVPDKRGIEPVYGQKKFSNKEKLDRLCLIASGDGREGSIKINQDAHVYSTILETDGSMSIPVKKERHLWIQVARGQIKLNDIELSQGDGASVSDETGIEITALDKAEVLVFDLA